MINRSLTARLLGPTGLVIAGLGLLLPFGAVSCAGEGSDRGQSVTLTFSGADLIGNDGGTVSVTPDLARRLGDAVNNLPRGNDSRLMHEADTTGTRILLIVMVALLVLGVLAVLIRQQLVRATVLAAVAVSAAILLVGAQASGHHAVVRLFAKHPELFSPNEEGQALPDGVDVHPGAGFWLSLALLIVVGVGSVVAIFRNTRRPRPPDAALPALPDGERTKT